MEKDKIYKLLRKHKSRAALVTALSREIILTIQQGIAGNEEALEKLERLNHKNYNILGTFLKVSDLMFDAFKMEHRLAGSILIKDLEALKLEDEEEDSYQINDDDVEIMKHFINRYESKKDASIQ
jgi:hypothetical protein